MALILMMHDLIVDLYQKIMFVNGLYRLLHKKDLMVKGQLQQPRSNSPARKRLVPGNSGDFVEAVFRPEMFQIFSMLSVQFLHESTGMWEESARKNPDNFRPEYCFYVPPIPGVFLQDPAGSGARNHRPGWITIFYVRIKIHLERRKFFAIFSTKSKALHVDK